MSPRSAVLALLAAAFPVSAAAYNCDSSGAEKTRMHCSQGATEECLKRLVPYVKDCKTRLADKLKKGDAVTAKLVQDRYDEAQEKYGDLLKKSEEYWKKNGAAAGEGDPTAAGGGRAKSRAGEGAPAREDASEALAAGDPAKARKILDRLLAAAPDDAAALALRSQALMALGDRAGAADDARRAVALDPSDGASRALVSELEHLSQSEKKVGKLKLDFGGQRQAEDGRSGGGRASGAGPGGTAAGPAPYSPPAPQIGAVAPAERLLLQKVRQLLDIGDFTGALLPLREAIDLDPKRGELWDMLAEVSSKLGNPQGAVDAADHALALDPKDARALRAKSYAEYQLGKYAEAFADAEKAIALDPGSGLGYLYRAMAEEKLGDAAKALADYREAMRLDPALAPLAEAAIKRLGGAGPAPAEGGAGSRRAAFWIGAVALSTLLFVVGLMGTAAGRRLTRRLATPLPAEEDARTPPAPATMAIGALIGGHYRVTRELGRGGMGVVYLAHDESLQRPVAIKQLQREGRENGEDRERFLREARLVAQLKHPHLAQIYSVVAEGDLLLVFEYVDGEPLDGLLSRAKVLAPARVRTLVLQLCDALQYAHERKIIHRDLKPANVMIDAAGAAKIMDFGIAHQARGAATTTQTSVSGTPPYMSPEQGFGSVSKSSDLYALAVMTYEMLTGARPFEGPDFLEPKLRKEFAPASTANPALGPGVDAFFSAALEPDPTKRPADAAAFALAFGRALDATPSRA